MRIEDIEEARIEAEEEYDKRYKEDMAREREKKIDDIVFNSTISDVLLFISLKNGVTVETLAKKLGVSERHIQSKIKQLGYKWDSKRRRRMYHGDEPEPKDIIFSSLFDKNTPKIVKTKPLEDESMPQQSEDTSIKTAIPKVNNSEYDEIDMLLEKKPTAKKVYRGFYFEEDVLSIIDSVADKQKSKLVNAALRKVFTDKGHLK